MTDNDLTIILSAMLEDLPHVRIEQKAHHTSFLVGKKVFAYTQDEGVVIKLPKAKVKGLVRFLSTKPNATEADHDRRTDSVIANVLASGEAFFSGTTWQGKRCMRVSVCNWNTKDRDVERAIKAVRLALTKR